MNSPGCRGSSLLRRGPTSVTRASMFTSAPEGHSLSVRKLSNSPVAAASASSRSAASAGAGPPSPLSPPSTPTPPSLLSPPSPPSPPTLPREHLLLADTPNQLTSFGLFGPISSQQLSCCKSPLKTPPSLPFLFPVCSCFLVFLQGQPSLVSSNLQGFSSLKGSSKLSRSSSSKLEESDLLKEKGLVPPTPQPPAPPPPAPAPLRVSLEPSP
mmetsp:Transcript_2218/g.5257  ORF Transcript_2218/g.5257 Transcript_2218/m.5257 type:complete len:212 (-) Transcript_2218:745-1380(-)